jgi:ankyrin repeat protein
LALCLSGPYNRDEKKVKPSVELLLDRGADPNYTVGSKRTPLIYACALRFVDTAHILLEYGADPNLFAAVDESKSVVRPSWSPLCAAVRSVSVECVRLLLEFGADPKLRTTAGQRAIDIADTLLARKKGHHRQELEEIRDLLDAAESGR